MTSDFWVGRYVNLHLMISDVGRWVGQRGSDIRFAIFEFLLFSVYRISSYSFRRNYSFFNLEIQRSQYIRPEVTVHKCVETIQGRKYVSKNLFCLSFM